MTFIKAKSSCADLPALQDIDVATLLCIADGHAVAVALLIIFAFVGAIFFSPSSIK